MPTAPKKPQDHRAPDTEPRVVDFKGVSVELPAENHVPMDFYEFLEEGQIVAALKALLGEDAYAELRKTVFKTDGDLKELIEIVTDSGN